MTKPVVLIAEELSPATIDALEAFTDTIYLSQTTQSRGGELTRYLNPDDRVWLTSELVELVLDGIQARYGT